MSHPHTLCSEAAASPSKSEVPWAHLSQEQFVKRPRSLVHLTVDNLSLVYKLAREVMTAPAPHGTLPSLLGPLVYYPGTILARGYGCHLVAIRGNMVAS